MSEGLPGDFKQALSTLALPVYQDLAKPATIQVGLALETVAKTVVLLMSPLNALIWGHEQFASFLEVKVAGMLKGVPPENIRTPPADVAVPLMESVRLKGDTGPLVDLYAQLLASAMQHRPEGQQVHPAFVEVLKQLSPDDAAILNVLYLKLATPFLLIEILSPQGLITTLDKRFTILIEETGVETPKRVGISIDNLVRLGLVEAIVGSTIPDESLYADLEDLARQIPIDVPLEQLQLARGTIVLRDFGGEFCRACMEKVGLEQRVSLRVTGSNNIYSAEDPYLVILVPKIAVLRISGLAELISDIRIKVVGEIRPKHKITIKVYLNTNVTSRLEQYPWSEAAIYVGRERIKLARARQIGPNALLFENIELKHLADLPTTQRYVTISGIRCNADQLGFGRIEVFLEVDGLAVRSYQQQSIARMVEDLSVSVYCDPSCTLASAPSFVCSNSHNQSLLSNRGGKGNAEVFLKVSQLFELDPVEEALPSSERLRLLFRFNNIPYGVSLFVGLSELFEPDQNPRAALILAADANGAGQGYGRVVGSHALVVKERTIPCRNLTIENGSSTAVYALALPASKYSTLVFAIGVAYESKSNEALPGLGSAVVNISLAPMSTVSTASASAPIPRFADRSSFLNILTINTN